jgi:hypothetical protein
VGSQSFSDAQRLGVLATNAQIAAEQAADPDFTSLVGAASSNSNQN